MPLKMRQQYIPPKPIPLYSWRHQKGIAVKNCEIQKTIKGGDIQHTHEATKHRKTVQPLNDERQHRSAMNNDQQEHVWC